jgi:hypothetical protein
MKPGKPVKKIVSSDNIDFLEKRVATLGRVLILTSHHRKLHSF